MAFTYTIDQEQDQNDPDNDEEQATIIDIQTIRNPFYLLWLVVGIAIGLACIKLTFATVQFGDPLDNTDPHQWYIYILPSQILQSNLPVKSDRVAPHPVLHYDHTMSKILIKSNPHSFPCRCLYPFSSWLYRYCAIVCSTLWCSLFSAVNCSLIHELLVKRR